MTNTELFFAYAFSFVVGVFAGFLGFALFLGLHLLRDVRRERLERRERERRRAEWRLADLSAQKPGGIR